MNLELLQHSCERLPKLVDLKSPTGLLIAELQILTGLALEAVQDRVSEDLSERLELHRKLKATDGP